MSNAVERALNRASAEQRERNQQVIEEARRNIQLVSVQQIDDLSPSSAESVARNAQTIEEAKRNIPFETMKDVDEISPPLPTPSLNTNYNSNVVNLHPDMQEKIESIEQGGGNNYLNENAIDRAKERQDRITQDQARYDQERKDQERQQDQAIGR